MEAAEDTNERLRRPGDAGVPGKPNEGYARSERARDANDAMGRERRDGARTALEMQAAWPWQPRGCERHGGAQASLGTRATCKLMDGPKAGGRPGNAGDAALRGRM